MEQKIIKKPKTAKEIILEYLKDNPQVLFTISQLQKKFPELSRSTINSSLHRLHLEGIIEKPERGRYSYNLFDIKDLGDERPTDECRYRLTLRMDINSDDEFLDDSEKLLVEISEFLLNLIDERLIRKDESIDKSLDYTNKIMEYLFMKHQLEYFNKNVRNMVDSLPEVNKKKKDEFISNLDKFYKTFMIESNLKGIKAESSTETKIKIKRKT